MRITGGRCAALLTASTLGAAAACGSSSGGEAGSVSPGPTGTVTVFAAASLGLVIRSEISAFGRRDAGVTVQLDDEGSQQLVAKLEAEPAAADVFISADRAHMDAAATHMLVLAPRTLARNRLVVVVPRANPGHVGSLADLARSGVRLSVADVSVPAGALTARLFAAAERNRDVPAGFTAAVNANVVSREDNVEGVVAKVAAGEVDAGAVYATDARAVSSLSTVAVPARDVQDTVYPMAQTRQAPNPRAAAAFIAFLLCAQGQDILRRAGFAPA